MEPARPSTDQRLTEGERRVLFVLAACFALGSLSLALKGLSRGGVPLRSVETPPRESPTVSPAPTPHSKPGVRVPKAKATASPRRLVDLNKAGTTDLESLPGVGPVLAQRILEDRARRGPFHSLDELGRVKGVGLKLLVALKGKVAVNGVPQ